jgi:ceramide glucosyltransferase
MYAEWWVVAPAAASLLLYLISTGSFVRATLGARRARRSGDPIDGPTPSISILKPLAGADDDLMENLESFARLDYPDYELLLGVASWTDKAAPVARRFKEAHPNLRIRVIRTDPRAAVNPKVSQLLGLEAKARGSVVVISDSNVRVAPDYLRILARELSVAKTALVTNVIRGTGERSLGAMFENLQLASAASQIVAASRVARTQVCVGKSMAMRREALHAIGGLRAVADVLAEDQVLGMLFARNGWRVGLSLAPVDNRNVTCGVRRTVERHTRWAKMRRALAPGAYWLIEPLMLPIAVTALALALHPSRLAAAGLAASVVTQTLGATIVISLQRGALVPWAAPLELLRTGMALWCWLSAVASKRVEWRGHAYAIVDRSSRIVPAPGPSWPRLRAARRVWAILRA